MWQPVGAGLCIEVEISGNDLDEMSRASQKLVEQLETYEGLFDQRDTFSAGQT